LPPRCQERADEVHLRFGVTKRGAAAECSRPAGGLLLRGAAALRIAAARGGVNRDRDC